MDIFLTYIIKPLVIFIVAYIFFRLAGKKAVSEMNSFDILFIIVIGTVLSEPLVNKNTGQAILYGAVFLTIYIFFSYATLNNKLRWLLIAKPSILIRNGDIDEKGLNQVRMTTSELLSQLREKGYTKTADVELAMMEEMGKISVIPKSEARPLQPKDIQLQPSPTFIPIPIILNGQILYHNLNYLKKDEHWLDMQLNAYNLTIENISDITLATYTQEGTLSVDTDNPNDQSNTDSPYLYKPGKDN
ncbi:YetF domain-containing protein [Aquibacillus albus]|uniref:Uncharacterized membrane protein YcaP (DUF421 family) n=1 Tax=Aquibacillus albus TaxID=1168171 RepID=A0ABS2N2J6_9BACI|nr:DUF421 domain-containing protein [Aquibacillus albus]MBM7572328.1 uncharacterized membrane protein YcaP (DUF421 family) [Aquibacillus albus]